MHSYLFLILAQEEAVWLTVRGTTFPFSSCSMTATSAETEFLITRHEEASNSSSSWRLSSSSMERPSPLHTEDMPVLWAAPSTACHRQGGNWWMKEGGRRCGSKWDEMVGGEKRWTMMPKISHKQPRRKGRWYYRAVFTASTKAQEWLKHD